MRCDLLANHFRLDQHSVVAYGRAVTDILVEWLRSFGSLSLVSGMMVATVFAVAAFVFVPRTFLTLGVGGLYGLPVIPLILVGATVGSVLAFLMARYFVAGHVQRRRLARLADLVGSDLVDIDLRDLLRWRQSAIPKS